jgi:sugar transferase (PEP-CTERM system associated)
VVALVVLEYVAMMAAVYLGHTIRFSWYASASPYLGAVAPQAHTYAGINLLCMIAMGAYRPRNNEGITGSVLRSMVAIFLIGTAVLSLGFYVVPTLSLYFGHGVLAVVSLVALTFIAILRWLFHRFMGFAALHWQVLIIGAGEKAKRLTHLLAFEGEDRDMSLVGFWPVTTAEPQVPAEQLVEPGPSLYDFCLRHKIQEIVVAVDERRRSDQGGFPLDPLLDCKLNGIYVIDDLGFLERESGKLDIRSLSPGWLVFSDGFSFSPLRDLLERGFDLAASCLLLALTWPFMLMTAVAIKLEEGIRAPLIYSQERVGYGGRSFRVHKFRSMRIDAEKDGKAVWAQKNDNRVTRVGQFIRQTRIDELPQLFNVINGEMSFVGPRPERPQFVEQLAGQIPYYRERHRVKPGITGWAQLCYPYGASVEDAEEKLKYDLYYIKNHSLLFDLYILVRTVEVILLGNGVR